MADAPLAVRRDDFIVAILTYDGRPCIAASPLAELGDGPDQWGSLPPAGGSGAGRCGSWLWAGGVLDESAPLLIDAGPSWSVAASDSFWLATGSAAEAPREWQLRGGKRGPTGFHEPPLA